MIPTIGIMIGFYIVTRMISLLLRKDARAEHILVKVFAIITILVNLICVADLMLSGTRSLP